MLTEANLKFCIKIIYFDKQTKQKKPDTCDTW